MKLTKYEDFFSEDLYKECIDTAKDILLQGGHNFCTNGWWNREIVKDSFPVLIHSIHRESKLFNNIRKGIENKTKLTVKHHDIMFYYWTRFSYIPWHEDKIYAGSLTVYLNEKWDPDFGGYFLYEDNKKEIRAVLPKPNLGLLQQGGFRHSTSAVNYDGGMRISIQVFLEEP